MLENLTADTSGENEYLNCLLSEGASCTKEILSFKGFPLNKNFYNSILVIAEVLLAAARLAHDIVEIAPEWDDWKDTGEEFVVEFVEVLWSDLRLPIKIHLNSQFIHSK